MQNPQARPVRWWHARPTIVLLLIAFYPVGVAMLLTSPRPRRWERVAGAIGFLPLFVLLLVLVLMPFWDFGGGMQLSGFSIDLDRPWQYDRLERHRSQRREQGTTGAAVAPINGATWTDFRGPRRDGVVSDQGISLDWRTHPPREIYRQPVGEGYASFVVARGRAFTIEQRRGNEAIVCYNLADGRELWKTEYGARFEETLGGDGPRATPTYSDGRIYALGATGRLHCLDAITGQHRWDRDILAAHGADNLSWGMSGSPLVIDGTVLVTTSGKTEPSILGYDAETGEPIWSCRAGLQSYSSLTVATLAGRRQILNLAGKALNGIDPATGELLWSFPWPTEYDINVAQPLLVGDDRVFISSGYGHGCAMLRVERDGESFEATELWSNVRMKNKFSSSVLHDGHLYGLDDRVLACMDVETGERRWKAGRYDYGSVLLVDDHLLVMTERGELILVRATPESHQELGRIRIFDDRTWNHFVVIDGRLLARNHKEMACYDLRPPRGG